MLCRRRLPRFCSLIHGVCRQNPVLRSSRPPPCKPFGVHASGCVETDAAKKHKLPQRPLCPGRDRRVKLHAVLAEQVPATEEPPWHYVMLTFWLESCRGSTPLRPRLPKCHTSYDRRSDHPNLTSEQAGGLPPGASAAQSPKCEHASNVSPMTYESERMSTVWERPFRSRSIYSQSHHAGILSRSRVRAPWEEGGPCTEEAQHTVTVRDVRKAKGE